MWIDRQELLYTIIQTPGQTDPFLLQVYRLAFDVDVLRGPEDYIEMATLANDQGSPGEAERVLGGLERQAQSRSPKQPRRQRIEELAPHVAVGLRRLAEAKRRRHELDLGARARKRRRELMVVCRRERRRICEEDAHVQP